MAAGDARPVPRKNVAYRVTFPILDADGDLVTGAATPDSEVSIDGGTFADCTNEATEIATASGMYFLDLTAAEMNGDTIAVIVKTATAGAKTTPIVMYPEEVGDYRANVVQWNGTTVPAEHTAGYPIVTIKDGTGTGEIDTVSGGVTVKAADLDTIINGVWDEAASDHVAAGSFGGNNQVPRSSTAQAGAASTITLDTGASAVDDFYNFTFIQLIGGTGVGQTRLISDYVGSTKVATVLPNWATNPDVTSVFVIRPFGAIDVQYWREEFVLNLVGSRVDANMGSATANAITATSLAASASAEIATAIWDELTATARAVGSYGQLFKDDIDAAISSRATSAQATSIQADTDDIQTRLPASLVSGRIDASVGAMAANVLTASALAADAVIEIIDGLLDRDMATGADSGSTTVRTVRQALRALRNRMAIVAGTLTVYKEDDVTASWTGAISTTAGDPISELNPAGP